MTKRTLLLDADVIAFSCAAACEQAVEWDEGYWTWHVGFAEVTKAMDEAIDRAMDHFDADTYYLCLTDPEHNFRRDILPTYKGNRTGKRPLVLMKAKEWMVENRGGLIRSGLEGDDLMGILATAPHKGERIIVSIDKDMKTIPCNFARGMGAEVHTITEAEADYWHLYQTLTGDTTDGYSGCPSVGPKKAEALLELGATIADNWASVVKAYDKAGLGEEEALRQAQVARILRHTDYDNKKKVPILWQPPSATAETVAGLRQR